MDATLLHQVGLALYGPRWQCELARTLGVSDRTMRRWAAGTHRVPLGARSEMREAIRARHATLAALEMRLQAEIDAQHGNRGPRRCDW